MRIGTRSGGGRIDAASGGWGRIVEAGKVALLEGESTRRVAAQRLEEWRYDAAPEHEKPRIARHERPPPWPLPLPLAPPPSPDPHPGSDSAAGEARDGGGCEEADPHGRRKGKCAEGAEE